MEQWEAWKAHDLCAEEECLSAAEASENEDFFHWKPAPNKLIRGRVWYQNGTSDHAFAEELRKFCFTCAFWHEAALNDEMHLTAPDVYPLKGIYVRENVTFSPVFGERFDIVRYSYNASKPVSSETFRGFGGRTFSIKLLDDTEILKTIVTTNDLWCQGKVPEWLKYLFEVNAEFMAT